MLDLIFIGFFQSTGGEFSNGHPPPPFRQEMVNQSAQPFGRMGENPHFANRCRTTNVGSRIQRQRCRRVAQEEAAQAEEQPVVAAETATEQTTTPPQE
ncbi:MAG: hypothetical protein GC206_14155 [Alphaproteobacteria bacterium]|nr:hypothetical protein [Alphaproteobacteria bacterium]